MIPLLWRATIAASYVAGWALGKAANAPFAAWRRWVR